MPKVVEKIRCMHARKEGRKDARMDEVTCLYIYIYVYILIHIHTNINLCDLNVGGCVRVFFTQTKLVDVFLMN